MNYSIEKFGKIEKVWGELWIDILLISWMQKE